MARSASGGDRVTYASYDTLGRVLERTDANGFAHYSSYTSQGWVAKEWQGVTGNDGVTHTLYRAYQYDALGHQTHVLEPGTDAANATVSVKPKATVTVGIPPAEQFGFPLPGDGHTGTLALQLASVIQAQGGNVRVDFDYIAYERMELPIDGSEPELVPAHSVT